MASGAYTTGAVTVAPITSALLTSLDADFKAENIAEGVNMFGLAGTRPTGAKIATGTVTVSPHTAHGYPNLPGITIAGLGFMPTQVFGFIEGTPSSQRVFCFWNNSMYTHQSSSPLIKSAEAFYYVCTENEFVIVGTTTQFVTGNVFKFVACG